MTGSANAINTTNAINANNARNAKMDKARKTQYRQIRNLMRERKVRDRTNLFVAEGLKIVEDTLTKGHKVLTVFVSSKVMTSPSTKKMLSLAEEKKVSILRVPAVEFEGLSDLRNSQGVLAMMQKPDLKSISMENIGKFSVLCDGVQDPGNMGAIIRSAVAFGAGSVILFGETVDVFNPKVIRASAGTVLDIPVFEASANDIDKLKSQGCVFLGGTADASRSMEIHQVRLTKDPCIAVFGSEGKGLSSEIAKRIDEYFSINIDGKVESLNVTAAAAIALYVLNQKRKAV